MKPGSASFPFFGVKPKLLDEGGTEIKGEGEGYLVRKNSCLIQNFVFNDLI